MISTVTTESWEQFFAAELDRLRRFYSIELGKQDYKEIEEWLKDRLGLRSGAMISEQLRTLPECDVRQLRYEFIQLVKRNRRFRKPAAHGRTLPEGAADALGEREERDSRTE
jgi:hypothetical protein